MKKNNRFIVGMALAIMLIAAMASVAIAAGNNNSSGNDAAALDKVSRSVISSIKNGERANIENLTSVNGVPFKNRASFNAKTVKNALLAEIIAKKLGVKISCFLLDGDDLYFNGVRLSENDKYNYAGRSFKLSDFEKALNKKMKNLEEITVRVGEEKYEVSVSDVMGKGGLAALVEKYENNKPDGVQEPTPTYVPETIG